VIRRVLALLAATVVSLLFLYPYAWMVSSAFRSTREILAEPLRLWPESPSAEAFGTIAEVGGVSLVRAMLNSVAISGLSTLLSVIITALGAYALTRRPGLWPFRMLRGGSC
jgi:ABC-type glycerol-3-phosphate transport system permease component